MRLFFAIELPLAVKERLLRLQPHKAVGIGLSEASMLHLTLHFIGVADLASLYKLFEDFRFSSFPVEIMDIGCFSTSRGKVLWAGVNSSAQLDELRSQMAKRLKLAGFLAERRAYKPHITLACSRKSANSALIEGFLQQQYKPMAFDVRAFSLFDSCMSDGVREYRRLKSYPLM